MKKIVFIAGDKSGDLYGGLLAQHVKELYPEECQLYSFGGPSLEKHTRQIVNLLDHSVSGLFEVAFHLKKLLFIFNKTYSFIEQLQPDLIIPIDFPDFNLRLAKKINNKFPIFYYISPQVWAWRKSRLAFIKKYTERVIVIFRFEQAFYKNAGADALYFGHPLLEIIPQEKYETKKLITFLPGSRKNEIAYHLPIMEQTKKLLAKELNGYRFQIIRADHIDAAFYQKFSPTISLRAHSYQAIAESEFIISSSGTATVEIAILGVPFIILYKMHPASFWLLKHMVRLSSIGMVNILSSKRIVDEFIQDRANPTLLAQATLSYLQDTNRIAALRAELHTVKELLTPHNASRNFAAFIGNFLGMQ